MRAFIVVYKLRNGKNKQIVILRDGYEGNTIDEQIAESDSDFAEVVTIDKVIESTIIEIR